MRPPIVPDEPPAVLREAELKAIFGACSGPSSEDRRDTVIVRLLLDTGMRRAKLTGLKVDDVDLDQQVAIVMGKGRRPRACPFGSKTAQALDRYLPKPDISILSDEFLAEVRDLPKRNLAVELLRKLLSDEIKIQSRRNLVESRAFSKMLERSLRKYQSRAIEKAAVIEELIEIAKQIREARERGEKLGLSDDDLSFHDALETNDSAVAILGDDTLRTIARELVGTVRRNTTIDWAEKESVRAKLRLIVKRVLERHGYPPDKQENATRTVLEQVEVLSTAWGVEPPPDEEAAPEADYPIPTAHPRGLSAAAERGQPLDGARE